VTQKSARILVVDDESDLAADVARILRGAGYETIVETESLRVLQTVERERPDLVLTDLRMPEIDGLALLERLKVAWPSLTVVVLTAYASVDSAVEAMQRGAADYLAKPFVAEELLLRVDRALAWTHLTEQNRYLQERLNGDGRHGKIIGQSPKLTEVLRVVERVASTNTRVLVVGESGTGKELIARTIHQRSPRRDRPFFAVNCGSLAESLLESELFGHERGAFTGALATRKGIFELANGGTLLLDEIGETSSAFQTKLLRVVQEEEFVRVGGARQLRTDVRLIASSNRDLLKAVTAGSFREDLYYRLGVVCIDVPPLRHRPEDIPALAEHFLAVSSQQIKKRIRGLRGDTVAILVRYAWPGNVRELENVIERSVIMANAGDEILPEHLPSELTLKATSPAAPSAGPMDEVRAAEHDLIVRTLRECNGNRSMAAKKLGIGRRTLYEKIARLGVSMSRST